MSEKEKTRLEAIAKALTELPEAKQERAAGIIEGMAMAEKKKINRYYGVSNHFSS